MSGEHTTNDTDGYDVVGSSPRERGALALQVAGPPVERIIPA